MYVWLPRDESVGHSSMTLGNGTHISLWPDEGKRDLLAAFKAGKGRGQGGRRNEGERSESLEEDLELKGYQYDHIFNIDGLDEDAIQTWWDNFNTRWNLLSQNCCKTVIDGLRAGGSDGRLNREAWIALNWRYFQILAPLLWTPVWVQRYCSVLE